MCRALHSCSSAIKLFAAHAGVLRSYKQSNALAAQLDKANIYIAGKEDGKMKRRTCEWGEYDAWRERSKRKRGRGNFLKAGSEWCVKGI